MVSVENQLQHNFSHSDQRYLPRWEVQNRVLYSCENDSYVHEAQTKDLSCAGACLRVEEALSPSQKVKMTVFLSENISVKLDGVVSWTKPANNEVEVGVSFYNTPMKVLDLILEYAFEFKHEEVEKQWFKGWK